MEAHRRNSEFRIPLILIDSSSVPAFQIFNPNAWEGDSRAVVQSCSTEFSVLQYEAIRIAEMCRSSKDQCQPHFENLKNQWGNSRWDLAKTICYGQVPELHMLIEGFFSGMKSLLDLIVQLLSTENVVACKLDGFHKTKDVYGGVVLNALDNNACSAKKHTANILKELIIEHKRLWIDEVITSRNLLIHPTKGVHQLMFEILVESNDGTLIFKDAVPPFVGEHRIDRYSAAQIDNIRRFVQEFLKRFRN